MSRRHGILAAAFARPCNALRAKIADEMVSERWAQILKWGQQRHPDRAYSRARYYLTTATILKEFNDNNEQPGWDSILLEKIYEALAEEDPAKLREELVQSMAVIAAWIEDVDTRE